MGNLSFGMTDADMALNIQEYHNFNLADKTKLNNEAFKSLKAGGTLLSSMIAVNTWPRRQGNLREEKIPFK